MFCSRDWVVKSESLENIFILLIVQFVLGWLPHASLGYVSILLFLNKLTWPLVSMLKMVFH